MANVPVLNMRVASLNAAAVGVPPRAQKIHVPRRRLMVTVLEEPAQTVKIRQLVQNLDTAVSEPKRVQEQRI